MSNLTDIILTCSALDSDPLAILNELFDGGLGEISKSPFNHLTGQKNYLDQSGLVAIVQEVPWHCPGDVQLFLRGEHDSTFNEVQLDCRKKLQYVNYRNEDGRELKREVIAK